MALTERQANEIYQRHQKQFLDYVRSDMEPGPFANTKLTTLHYEYVAAIRSRCEELHNLLLLVDGGNPSYISTSPERSICKNKASELLQDFQMWANKFVSRVPSIGKLPEKYQPKPLFLTDSTSEVKVLRETSERQKQQIAALEAQLKKLRSVVKEVEVAVRNEV